MVAEPALDLVQKAKLWILLFPRVEKAQSRKKQAWADPHLKVSDPCTQRLMPYLEGLTWKQGLQSLSGWSSRCEAQRPNGSLHLLLCPSLTL